MYDLVNRTTWQIQRQTEIMPTSNSGKWLPDLVFQPIATYVTSNVPSRVDVRDIPGSPIVSSDNIIPNLPASADVLEGDRALNMEKGILYEVVASKHFPSRVVAWLRTVQNKSSQVAQ